MRVVVAQIAVVGRRGAKHDVRTQVVAAALAVVAGSARHARFDGHSITCIALQQKNQNVPLSGEPTKKTISVGPSFENLWGFKKKNAFKS